MDGCHCAPGEHQEPMSLRAYGRHRGCSGPAVIAARNKGRLVECFKLPGGAVSPQVQNVALADREWAQKTDLFRAPAYVKERAGVGAKTTPEGEPSLTGSIATNNAAKVYWQAKQAELDYREAAGELVPAADVRSELESVFMTCRTRLLGIPSRARAAMPGLTVGDVALIEGLVREALEGLASGELVKGAA